jgi:hypothetical protein
MLFYALLQMKSEMTKTTLELILRGRGMSGGMTSHGDLVLVQIRDETFREESHVEHFCSSLNGQGLKLLLLTEPSPEGVNEILYPKPYGKRRAKRERKPDSPEVQRSDEEANQALRTLCEFLAATLGREWEHKQRIWKHARKVPCA